MLFQRHSSDESLIAWLDGELPFYRRPLVRRHLAVCWKCRLRLSEIEKQVLDVTRAMEGDTFPGPQRVIEARLRFLESIEQQAPCEAARPTWGRRLAWAAVCLLLVAGGWWISRRPTAPGALVVTEIVRQAEQAEARVTRSQVQQEFRVVARQLRPREVSVESRLEVWAEPAADRFASRLSDNGGVLRHALWRPATDRSYVYNPARSVSVVSWSRREVRERWPDSLLREGLTLEDLEASLLTWLENRPWRPVSLISGVTLAAVGDGEALKAEVSRSAAGPEVIRLSAWKRSGAVSVGFILEVDPRTFVPKLQCIRYESPGRTLELWLYADQVHAPRPAVYEPPVVRAAAPPPLPLYPEPRTPLIEPAPPPVADPLLTEIEVYYALHRLRACLGEAVEVLRQPGGALEVKGVVVDEERKQQIAAALAEVPVRIDIRSVAEALGEFGPEAVKVGQSRAVPGTRRKELLASLYNYFSKDETALDKFADRALSQSEELIFEAQALRQLAGTFLSRGEPSSQRARWLLDVMTYDHLTDLQAKLEAVSQSLRPPLLAAAGQGYAPRAALGANPARNTTEEAEEIFRLSRLLNERLRSLFGAGGEPADRLTRDALDSIPPLQAAVRDAAARALRARQ